MFAVIRTIPRAIRVAGITVRSVTSTTEAWPYMLHQGLELVGESGVRYKIDRIIQEKYDSTYRVCLARSISDANDGQIYVIKNRIPDTFEFKAGLERMVADSPYIRSLHDITPEKLSFVYKHRHQTMLDNEFWALPGETRKSMLKDVLKAIAVLHKHNICHTDIKANNVHFDWQPGKVGQAVARTQLSDIDDAVDLEPNSHLAGIKFGNQNWRSPEAWTMGPVELPSDMFSFAILCIYGMMKILPFHCDEATMKAANTDETFLTIHRMMSFFGNDDDLAAFQRQIKGYCGAGFGELIRSMWEDFQLGMPQKRVADWKGMDATFADFLMKLTSWDIGKRMTAEEALKHGWWSE